MTPGARVAAAIAVLDQIRTGTVAEQALTAWARRSRYAGSKDRAAVRDHVFDVLRARRSLGDGDGRSLMIQLALRDGWAVDALFSGEGHAPDPVSPDERLDLTLDMAASCDVPEWLWPIWQQSLGAESINVGRVQQGRADVFLRVNDRRTTLQAATEILANDGIKTIRHPGVKGCLRVIENPRRIKTSTAYRDGLVELQDASSQLAIMQVPVPVRGTILDFCAGGGGKALGFADQHDASIFAHDIDPKRMQDLPHRAERAGATIEILDMRQIRARAPYDIVFCDAPCSGSGTWRRTPDAKWRLTEDRLKQLLQSQDDVLHAAAPFVKSGGCLVYATCSVLDCENADKVAAFLANYDDFNVTEQTQLLPSPDGDGFFVTLLRRVQYNL